MTFTFIPGPNGQGMTDQDFLTSAFDQPMSLGSTFWDQAKGGLLDSFGLGTAVRSFSLPISPDEQRRAGVEPTAALTQDQYKASPYFRDNVPWDANMTEDRAAALADMSDARKVREFYSQKRPITAFFGNLAGSATDPINYIPFAGEAVMAANTARFGRVAGRALTSAFDAAANTAVAGALTSQSRGNLGDDVSLQTTVSQIAMAALIGGAFGAVQGSGIGGRIADRVRNRFGRELPDTVRADIQERLATLDNVQTARVALNDAIDGLVRDGEVRLSEASKGFVADMANRELPKAAIARIARELEPEAFDRLDNLNRTFDINDAEIKRLTSQATDNERYGATRAQMIQADQMAERLQQAEQAIERASSDKERASAVARRDSIRNDLRKHLDGIDDNIVAEIEGIDESLRARRAAQEPVAMEREQLQRRTQELNAQARDVFWGQETQARNARIATGEPEPVRQDGASIFEVPAPRDSLGQTGPALSVDNSVPEVPFNKPLADAQKRVGTPETYRAMAEQYRVDPATGDFAELPEIEQLRAEGRLTPEDEAALVEADETLKNANGYAEALKAFANCVI